MPTFSLPAALPPPRRTVVVEGNVYGRIDWMGGSDETPAPVPTVFMVDHPAGASLRTHFHRHDQFQVFVGGSGTLGPHRLSPLSLHFAGAYTAGRGSTRWLQRSSRWICFPLTPTMQRAWGLAMIRLPRSSGIRRFDR